LKILLIYQYFGTPAGSWSTRIYELTKRWVDAGHKVTVITSPYDKSDIKANGLVSKQQVDGIDLIVINSGDSNRMGRFKRAFRAIRFSLICTFYTLIQQADVIICSSGPITVAIPGLVRRILRRTPFIFEVRDLWPLGGIVMGKIRNPLTKRFLLWLENFTYKLSSAVVTCSIGQKNNIVTRLGHQDKLFVIPNACDVNLFGKYEKLDKTQRQIIGDMPYVLHLGSLGYIHNCNYLLDVAKYCKGFIFVFIGDGADRLELEQRSVNENIDNVIFLGQVPKIATVSWLANCEMTLFTTLDNEVQNTSSPNKIFDSFAAGKPIIQTTTGWIFDLVENYNCGFNADVNSPIDFAGKLELYRVMNKTEKDLLSSSARELSQGMFNRDKLAIEYESIIKRTINYKKKK
jgi:glycosyltransferase involved in cell wall biosynthesis